MGNAQVEVVAACLGVTLYTSLGFFGASRVWARCAVWCLVCVKEEERERERSDTLRPASSAWVRARGGCLVYATRYGLRTQRGGCGVCYAAVRGGCCKPLFMFISMMHGELKPIQKLRNLSCAVVNHPLKVDASVAHRGPFHRVGNHFVESRQPSIS